MKVKKIFFEIKVVDYFNDGNGWKRKKKLQVKRESVIKGKTKIRVSETYAKSPSSQF